MKMQAKGDIRPPAHETDCGYDIFANKEIKIMPRHDVIVETGVRVRIPKGYFGRVLSRSGLSVKHKVEVGAGVIDSGYTGDLTVHLYNHSEWPVTIPVGKACAQLVVIPYATPELDFDNFDEDADRGEAGFGSTS